MLIRRLSKIYIHKLLLCNPYRLKTSIIWMKTLKTTNLTSLTILAMIKILCPYPRNIRIAIGHVLLQTKVMPLIRVLITSRKPHQVWDVAEDSSQVVLTKECRVLIWERTLNCLKMPWLLIPNLSTNLLQAKNFTLNSKTWQKNSIWNKRSWVLSIIQELTSPHSLT